MNARVVRALKRLSVAAVIGGVVIAVVYLSLQEREFMTQDELCQVFGAGMKRLGQIGLLFVALFSLYPKIRALILTVAMFFIVGWWCDRPTEKLIWLTNYSDVNRSVVIDEHNYTIGSGERMPLPLRFSGRPIEIDGQTIQKSGTYVVNLAHPQKYLLYGPIRDVARYGHLYEASPLVLSKQKIVRIDSEPNAWIDTAVKKPTEKKTYYIETVDSFNRRYIEEAKLYERGCSDRDPENRDQAFCFSLALRYELGKGVPLDYTKADKLYKEACERGYDDACHNMALLYSKGLGVAQDRRRAAELYRRACDNGLLASCFNLGIAYEQGLGVESNMTQAMRYFKKVCDAGDGEGCYNLALIYGHGYGGDRNLTAAEHLFGKACRLGISKGCEGYESLHQFGGVKDE